MVIDKKKFLNCYKGHLYAEDVINNKIVSNIYLKSICKTYIENLKRKDIILRLEIAEKFMRLFQRFEHVIGVWETPNIKLEPWQCFFYLNVEGFYWKDSKKRKYKTAHMELSRGNGKSCIASVTGLLYLNCVETVKGNKVYAAATKSEQARIVLDSAREMAKNNKSYLKNTGAEVFAHHIAHEKSGSDFKALASDSKSLDGLQPVLGIVDELHAHRDRTVYDVIDSAMSKRKDSLLFIITTAGFSLEGIGYSQSCYAKKVALNEILDESFFAVVYTIDEKDDWRDEKIWLKANPNMGISVDPDSFKSKAYKAQNNPQDAANFKVKHLNLWQNTASQYFSINLWDNLGDHSLKLEDFKKEKCYVGMDLASKIDLTSFGYVFRKEGIFYIFDKSYVPEATIQESKNEHYPSWVKEGYLLATQGNAINYPKLEDELEADSKIFSILGVPYDPWSANEAAQRLINKRIEMLEFRMTIANMSEPMKRLEALIREGRVRHNGSPLLRWCMSNVVARVDANENVYPRKDHERLKIDPAIAIIMGIACWIQEEVKESVYEDRGILVL